MWEPDGTHFQMTATAVVNEQIETETAETACNVSHQCKNGKATAIAQWLHWIFSHLVIKCKTELATHSTSGDYFQYQDDTFYLVGGNLIAKNPIQTDYNWWLPKVCK